MVGVEVGVGVGVAHLEHAHLGVDGRVVAHVARLAVAELLGDLTAVDEDAWHVVLLAHVHHLLVERADEHLVRVGVGVGVGVRGSGFGVREGLGEESGFGSGQG